ncbi:MAG: hypothetical protein ACR2HV_04060 [Acidimicrobiales bacterium]
MDPDVDPTEERPADEQEAEKAIDPSTRVERWRRNTASGAVAGALALGLQQVFDPRPTDTVGIEQEAPTKPDDVDRVQLSFDPLDSSNNRVVVRRPDPT